MIFWGFLAFASVFMSLVFQPKEKPLEYLDCVKAKMICSDDGTCQVDVGGTKNGSILKYNGEGVFWCKEQK